MKTFDEDSYKADLIPDSEYWKERPRISLKFLCYLAVGYDPKKFYSQLIHIEEHKKSWARINNEIAIIRLVNRKLDKTQKRKISELNKQQQKHDKIITNYEAIKYRVLDEANNLFKTSKHQLNQSIYDPRDSYNDMHRNPSGNIYPYHSITHPERDQVTLDPDIFSNWFYYYNGSTIFPDVLEHYLTSKEDIKPKLTSHINSNYYLYDEECDQNWKRWENEKELTIKAYSEDTFSIHWEPDWNSLKKFEVIPLLNLCYLAFNFDINKVFKVYENSDQKTKQEYFELLSLHESATQLYEQAQSFIITDKLYASTKNYEYQLYPLDFINWLKKNNINYPRSLERLINSSEETLDKTQIKNIKSSNTQSLNQAVRIIKQLVEFHYGENATAYSVAKNINTDPKTIKRYLDK